MPRFDSDRFIDGRHISFFNNQLGQITGRDAVVKTTKPNDWFRDDEIALRLNKNIKGYELAVYGYKGFWKSPAGFDPASGKAVFPPLSVYGASIRGVIGKGIGNLEFGYYDSEDDRGGDDPLIRNSEFRFLVGYSRKWPGTLQWVCSIFWNGCRITTTSRAHCLRGARQPMKTIT